MPSQIHTYTLIINIQYCSPKTTGHARVGQLEEYTPSWIVSLSSVAPRTQPKVVLD